MPLAPVRCSSCHRILSDVDRLRPLPLVTRRMQLSTTRKPSGGRSPAGVRSVPSSAWPTTAGSVPSSSTDVP